MMELNYVLLVIDVVWGAIIFAAAFWKIGDVEDVQEEVFFEIMKEQKRISKVK